MGKETIEILEQLHSRIMVLPRTRKKGLYERLRQKIGEDINTLLIENGIGLEEVAHKLEITQAEARKWIWIRDLRLTELSKLLDIIDCELYPLITSRIIGRK